MVKVLIIGNQLICLHQFNKIDSFLHSQLIY